MSMTMFEIKEGIRVLLERLYTEVDGDGCVSDDTMAELEALNEAKEDKIESIALYYKETQAEAEAIKAEAKKLAERAKSAENKAESLKNYLSRILQEEEADKFSTPRVKVSFRKSEQVIVDDVESLGEEFTKVKIEPDKTAIKKAIKDGNNVSGAHIETMNNIQIK